MPRFKSYLTVPDVGLWLSGGGSRGGINLNSAFVSGVSGAAVALRYIARTAEPIHELYLFNDLITGTLANVTMACELRNEAASTNLTQPGGTTRATASAMANLGTDKWVKFTFGTPYTPTIGEYLVFVVHNTSVAPATDYPTPLVATNLITAASPWAFGLSTTNGFSTSGTGQTEMPFVVKQGSDYFGNPITQQATGIGNNALQKGGRLILPYECSFYACQFIALAGLTGLRIYDAATGPGGTPLHSLTLGSDTNEAKDRLLGLKMFDSIITLPAGTYYVVNTYGGTTAATVMQIEDYASFSSVFDEFVDGMQLLPYVIDNGAGGWTVDKQYVAYIRFIMEEYPVRNKPGPTFGLGI